jgi:solute:Na+ symporter, SSS family
MILTFLDWAIILGFLIITLAIGLYFTKEAGTSTASFFLGGRNLPWWIAGVSMVATTFGADTPLLVTELVANNGISGNWMWWNFLIGGMITVFFFAKLWRKAEIITDVELVELRYAGKEAAFLRGFKAIYVGVFLNAIIIAWVNVALASILQVFFDIPESQMIWYVAASMVIVVAYSSLSGLLGVAFTDFIQFIIAMAGTTILAIIVVNSERIGGLSGLQAKLPAETFQFLPQVDFSGEQVVNGGKVFVLGLGSFLAFIGFQWWASWYPGAEPGGGGYIAQRMMSTRTEKDAIKATLMFQIMHYALRPLPWILVGLSSIFLYSLQYNAPNYDMKMRMNRALEGTNLTYSVFTEDPEVIKEKAKTNPEIRKSVLDIILINKELQDSAKANPHFEKVLKATKDTRLGYVYAMKDFLPPGLRGLLLIAFLSAYMSTLSTQLNWGTSYLINDFYERFMQPQASQKQLVFASRVATVLLMLISLVVTTQIKSLESSFQFMIEAGAGLGAVLILRWYWWRVNVWSEITATLAPFVGYGIAKFALAWEFPNSFFFTLGFTTIAWLLATYLTPPTPMKKLKEFYLRVEPEGAWKPVREALGLQSHQSKIPALLLTTLFAIMMGYSALFLVGEALFSNWLRAGIYTLTFIIGWWGVQYFAKKAEVF